MKYGISALILASASGQIEVVKLLLYNQAQVDLKIIKSTLY